MVAAVVFLSTGESSSPIDGACVFGVDFGLCWLRVEPLRGSAEQKRDKVRLGRLSCFSAKDLVTMENLASCVA